MFSSPDHYYRRKETARFERAASPFLQYLNNCTLAIALVIALAVLTSIRGNPLFPGATRPGDVDYPAGSARGYLTVYSGTDEFNDGGVPYYAHSSYAIYRADGKLFKDVENHISRSDETPEVVALPAGLYTVVARSAKQGYVQVRIVIKGGERTILNLDPGEKATIGRLGHS